MILAIDPGETVGLALFEAGQPILASEVSAEGFCTFFKGTLGLWAHKDLEVVIEDYRIFGSKAKAHIGQKLPTAEMIGAVEALCATAEPPVEVTRIEPGKKGKWPDARLQAKFPEGLKLEGHAKAALKIGLVYLEEHKGWAP